MTTFLEESPSRWDMRHYMLALHVSTWSKDPTTQVGAVIVGKRRRDIAIGYNGFPPGIEDLPERYMDRPTKYLFTQHAERNVLDNARFDCADATLVTTMFPCAECTKSLISKGIRRLVTCPVPAPLEERGRHVPTWRDSVPASIQMLKEAGVTVLYVGKEPVLVPGVYGG